MNDQTDRTKDHGSLPFFGIPKMMYLVRRFRKDLAVVIISTVVFGVMEVTFPVLQRYALNRFVEGGTLDGLGGFVLAYIVVIAVMAYSGYINCKVCMATELRMNTVMRNDAMAHLQKLSFDYYNTNSVGYIHARVMSDTGHIGETLTWNLNDGIFFSLTVIGSIAVMLSIDPKLTAMILVIVPVISVFYALFQGKLFRLNRQVREINSRITGQFNEGITGAKTIKSLVIEDRIFEDFESETEAIFKKSMEAARLKGVFRAVTGMAASAALAIVLWQGGLIAKEEIGTFSLFMTYARDLMEPVSMIVESLALFIVGKVNIGRYTALMEAVPNVRDSEAVEEKYGDCFDPKRENWEKLKGDIEFDRVDFKYPDGDELVLEDFSLKIPFGTNVAVVGETGAGKSTLVNLVCRFYEPTAGRVLIDGRDARERSQLWLHSSLGYVLQTPHLFSGTIRDNLLYGKPGASDEEIMAALDQVSARGMIEKLEKGLDTDVGEGGSLLSTGEKQLICFARAILADPRLLVLDEATASVDTITEQTIQAAIERVIKGRTSIVIAHRLSTVRNADIILVVKDGKIVEQGRHEELLEMGGYYSRLWQRQYEDEAAAKLWEERRPETA